MGKISDKRIREVTGRDRKGWFALLEERGARGMSHRDIARMLVDEQLIEDGWWSQTITVEYERHIGRRSEGQLESGEFVVSASRTFAAPDLDAALRAWEELVDREERDSTGASVFNGASLENDPEISATDSWRYWRVGLAGHGRVSIAFTMKTGGKATAGLSHEKIRDEAASASWKAFWKDRLARLQ